MSKLERCVAGGVVGAVAMAETGPGALGGFVVGCIAGASLDCAGSDDVAQTPEDGKKFGSVGDTYDNSLKTYNAQGEELKAELDRQIHEDIYDSLTEINPRFIRQFAVWDSSKSDPNLQVVPPFHEIPKGSDEVNFLITWTDRLQNKTCAYRVATNSSEEILELHNISKTAAGTDDACAMTVPEINREYQEPAMGDLAAEDIFWADKPFDSYGKVIKAYDLKCASAFGAVQAMTDAQLVYNVIFPGPEQYGFDFKLVAVKSAPNFENQMKDNNGNTNTCRLVVTYYAGYFPCSVELETDLTGQVNRVEGREGLNDECKPHP